MPPEKKKPAADAGEIEAQTIADESLEKGFIGHQVDPLPNSAHSLASGPDSPTIEEQREALKKAEADK